MSKVRSHRLRAIAVDTHLPVRSVLYMGFKNNHTEQHLGVIHASYEGSAIQAVNYNSIHKVIHDNRQ